MNAYRLDVDAGSARQSFRLHAIEEEEAVYEAEYVLGMEPVTALSGRLYRTDGGRDEFVAEVTA